MSWAETGKSEKCRCWTPHCVGRTRIVPNFKYETLGLTNSRGGFREIDVKRYDWRSICVCTAVKNTNCLKYFYKPEFSWGHFAKMSRFLLKLRSLSAFISSLTSLNNLDFSSKLILVFGQINDFFHIFVSNRAYILSVTSNRGLNPTSEMWRNRQL